MRKRAAVVAALVALPALAAVFAAPSANAHAALRSSQPASGDRLATAPDAIAITFTEQPELSLSSIRVLDASGAAFEDGKPAAATGDPLTIRSGVKTLGQGVYTVLWRVVSRVDGHATAGSFAFGVGVSPAGAPAPAIQIETTPPPSPLEMAGRLLLLLGIVALTGGAWFAVFVLAGGTGAAGSAKTRDDESRRNRRLIGLMAGGWLLSAAGVPLLAEAQRQAAGVGFGDLIPTAPGRALIWRGVAILVAGAAVAVAANTERRVRRGATILAGIAAAGAALAHVQAGHASATAQPAMHVAAQLVHVLAVSLWTGGFAALLMTIRGAAAADKTRAVRRFSATAAVALAVVLATGAARSLGELETLGDLTGTGYGRTTLIKIAVFAVLVALGAANRFRNIARSATSLSPLRSVVKIEAALAVVALGAAAVLSTLAPPSPAYLSKRTASPSQIVVSGNDFATSVRTRVTITPGFAGPNTITAALADYDSGRPIDADRVELRLNYLTDSSVPPAVVELNRQTEGVYAAESAALSLQGRWRLTLQVQQGDGSVEIPMTVATKCQVTATPAQGQPTLYDARLAGGASVQMYAQPAAGGAVEIHATLFDASGTETFVRSVAMFASRGSAAPAKLSHRRFSPGHFIARGTLTPGTWRFDITVATPDATYKTCFEDAIQGD